MTKPRKRKGVERLGKEREREVGRRVEEEKKRDRQKKIIIKWTKNLISKKIRGKPERETTIYFGLRNRYSFFVVEEERRAIGGRGRVR